jgi:hypothetical protein
MLKEPPPQKSIGYFAQRLSMGAREAAKRSPEYTPLALGSILMSVAWLEGTVNEFLAEVETGKFIGDLEPVRALQRLARATRLADKDTGFLQRLRVVAVCLTQTDIDLSSKDAQRLQLALDIRNAIAHPRPQGVDVVPALDEAGIPTVHLKAVPPITKRLVEAKVIKKVDLKIIQTDALAFQDPRVAEFVYGACRVTVENLLSWLPAHYQKLTNLRWALAK